MCARMQSHPPLVLWKNVERAFIVWAEDQENREWEERRGREGWTRMGRNRKVGREGRMILS